MEWRADQDCGREAAIHSGLESALGVAVGMLGRRLQKQFTFRGHEVKS
jgi:hypothetical protein